MQMSKRPSGGEGDGHGGLAVIAAMPEEVAPLIAALAHRRWVRRDGRRWAEGLLEGRRTKVMWSGEGRHNARRAANRLQDFASGCEVLIVGVAGALSPGLSSGAALVGRSIHCHGQVPQRPLRPSARCPLGTTTLEPADLLTIDEVVVAPDRRRVLWSALGCPGAAAVDMESYHLATAAASADLAWGVVRVVSDSVEDRLPAYLPACYDPLRGIRRIRVAAWAVRRPSTVGSLLELRRRLRQGAMTLGQVVSQWARTGPVGDAMDEVVV